MPPVPDEPEPADPEPEMPLEPLTPVPLTPVDPLPVAPTPELIPVPVPVVDLRCLVAPDVPLKSLPVPAPVPLLYDEPLEPDVLPEPDALPEPDVPVCACAHVPMLSNNAESKTTFLFFMSILLCQCLSAEFDDDLFLHGTTRMQVGHGRDVASENSSRPNCCDEGIRVRKSGCACEAEGG
jgi:hypothetical protein